MGGEKDGDIVEIGWNVSTHQYEGSADPHLFVFHWQGWQGTCYDGCGWEQVSQKFYPGQNLSELVGKEVSAGFAFHEGNWWAWFADEWIGYFPTEEWDGKFTQGKLVHWFGEVASLNGVPPRMEMGGGRVSDPDRGRATARSLRLGSRDEVMQDDRALLSSA